MQLGDLKIMSYCLREGRVGDGVTLERAPQRNGPDRWAIRCMGRVMDHQGEWQFEPMPSSRDDAFLRECRFATPEEALATWQGSPENVPAMKPAPFKPT